MHAYTVIAYDGFRKLYFPASDWNKVQRLARRWRRRGADVQIKSNM